MKFRLVAIFILLCLFLLSSFVHANSNKLNFAHYNITVPFKVTLPVLTIDLVESSVPYDELVVIGIDKKNTTWAAVYIFNEKIKRFELLDKILLQDEYFAYDISENENTVYFLSKNEVVTLKYAKDDHSANSLKAGLYLELKQKINSIFLLKKSNYLTKLDFIQDINLDGFDDIILPDFEKMNLWLFFEKSKTAFLQSLPIDTHIKVLMGDVIYKPNKLFFADFNLDNRQDIAWFSMGNLNYFAQNSVGQFTTKPSLIPLVDSFQTLNWWEIRKSDGEKPDQSSLSHRVIEQLKDMNGDGLIDVIVRYTQSSGVLDRTNDYEFYFGYQNTDGKLVFQKQANTVIKAEGTLTGLKILDVNNDKKNEVLLSSFELSLSNIIGALLSGGIDQHVLMFALNGLNKFEEEPLFSKEVELSFSLTSGQSGQPIVLLADVNGDSLKDLVLSSGSKKLAIYLGNTSTHLFNRKANQYKVLLPKDGDLFQSNDINHDGKLDFVMRYGRLDDKKMTNKITILLVK